jgi:hypothetical protein
MEARMLTKTKEYTLRGSFIESDRSCKAGRRHQSHLHASTPNLGRPAQTAFIYVKKNIS